MRRWLAMVAVFFWLPALALAVPETPYAPETVMRTVDLPEAALAALDVLYPAVRGCEEKIDLPGGTRYDDVTAAMQSLSRDYPELFHLENAWTIVYRQSEPEYATQVIPGYRMSPEAYRASLERLLQTARDMVGRTAGSQADRAEALHDRLCDGASYDGSETGEADNTAVGALLNGVTRCEGYAGGLALLYRLAGIPCGVVIGDAGDAESVSRHAWNVAVLDGQPTLIDATWNDQEEGGNTHWYYGLTDWMMAADHTPDPDMALPACTSLAVNWHARRGLLAADGAGIDAALRWFQQSGEVSIRFADAAVYADFDERINDWFSAYNVAHPDAPFYGYYGVIASEAQLCVRLRAMEEDELP